LSKRSHLKSSLVFAPLALAASLFAQSPATLTIQADKPVAKISPILYGLMTEEINYSYDGGLYGELVRDRTFRAHFNPPSWTLSQNASNGADMELDKSTGPSAALNYSVKLTVKSADAANPAGIKNTGYWGIPVRPNATYKASLYGKTDNPSSGPITVSIVSQKTGEVLAKAEFPALTSEWKKYDVTLRTGNVAVSSTNHLRLALTHPGTVWLDLVSLFPPTYKNRANGNRVDLMEKLAAMHPAFLRFPGGNYLEGDHINERYEWKKTIGPMVDRPTHPSPWNYHSSDGMGLLEFLEWCEDLNMQPVLAVYAGYSMKQEHVDPGPALEPYVQDALDELEYVTGGPDTKWGAERVKGGHPAPFKLTYVEIGNEDWFDRSKSYDGRYAQFYKAIKAKYPELQLIATMPVESTKPDVVDDHYYKTAQEFFADTHHYDKADRNGPKIFVGEWATMEGTPSPNFGAALGDAAWLTGMERNSDLIVMASYAPLFVNVNPGGMQWGTNLIGYNALNSYGSPSYYAQVLFSEYKGDEVIDSSLENAGSLLFYSATRDTAKKKIYLKVVNASPKAQTLDIKLSGASVQSSGKLVTLSAKATGDTNTITDPEHIVPVTEPISGLGANIHHTFAPYSINVLDISAK